MERKCLDCGEILQGRADKRFCSDQCRNNFHNKQNSGENTFVKDINAILRRNRRILADLIPYDKASVHKEKLSEKGFNFKYFTNTYTTKKGSVYHFCYEYGYLHTGNDFFLLVHRENKEQETSH